HLSSLRLSQPLLDRLMSMSCLISRSSPTAHIGLAADELLTLRDWLMLCDSLHINDQCPVITLTSHGTVQPHSYAHLNVKIDD
ncbi:hypothetical protein Bpfe_013113, partial [Biomphalaria pfeifferi]